jgi:hypothetical protein
MVTGTRPAYGIGSIVGYPGDRIRDSAFFGT